MGARDEYIAAMKSAFVSLATRLSLGWVVSFIPATWNPFALKLISIFLEPILKSLFKFLATTSELGAFFLYIDTRVGAQSKGFEESAFSNHRIQNDPTKSKKEKKDAEEDLWRQFEPFARLTG